MGGHEFHTDTAYNQFAGLINNYYNTNAVNFNDYPNPYNYRNAVFAMGLQADTNIVIGGSFFRVGGGNSRADIHTHMNVARIIGPPTHGPENGGIGNFPGNITMTQNPYSVDDTANQRITIAVNPMEVFWGPQPPSLGNEYAASRAWICHAEVTQGWGPRCHFLMMSLI